jgi:hypothetical protein
MPDVDHLKINQSRQDERASHLDVLRDQQHLPAAAAIRDNPAD